MPTPFVLTDPSAMPRRASGAPAEDVGEFDAEVAAMLQSRLDVHATAVELIESRAAHDPASDLPIIDPAQWHGPPPSREWYVDELIPSRTVTILTGDGGVGKSLLALQFAMASAMGIETAGLEPRACGAVYVGAEDEDDEFHRRMDWIARRHGRTLADLGDQFRLVPLADRDAVLASPNRAGVMQTTKLLSSLDALIADFEPGIVVLDTAADLFGGDEIKRGQVRQFIAMLRRLASANSCAVVLLSHPSVQGIQTGTGSSGSTAWNNSSRSRLYLTAPDNADPDARVLRTVKANYGPTGGEIRLRWDDGIFVVDEGRKPNIATPLINGMIDKTFMAVLRKLHIQGQRLSPNPSQSYAPRVIAAHPDAVGRTKEELVASMQRLLDRDEIRIVEEGPNSRRYKRILPTDLIWDAKTEGSN